MVEAIAENRIITGVSVISDPVEMHILQEVDRLRHQNLRYKSYVKKSGAWVHLKKIDEWKPYDFLQYFCTLYMEKYRKEYKVGGNIVRAYQRIETFQQVNKISNELYKEFIDTAFNRYFNLTYTPVIGTICSDILFNKLMGYDAKHTVAKDWFSVDQAIKLENEKFEAYTDDSEEFSFIDELIAKENKNFTE